MFRRGVWMYAKVGIFAVQLDPPTLVHARVYQDVMQQRGLERLVLVPHTKFAVTIPHSLHLAALASLSVRDEPNVTADLQALERPSIKVPRVAQLVSSLVEEGHTVELLHWHHDRHSIAGYEGLTTWLQQPEKFSVTLLQIPAVCDETESKRVAFRDDVTTALEAAPVLPVEHRRGSETRRLLFEGEVDPTTLVTPPVLKYMNSHHLYRDFRKLNRFQRSAYKLKGTASRGHNYDFAPHVATDGAVPRLEVIYDQANTVARELAHRLQDFTVGPGEAPDLIVPIGGDGFMMQSIRRHWHRFIPFFGVNAGHVGYLLNDNAHLEELMTSPLKIYHCAMLYAVAQRDTTERTTTGRPSDTRGSDDTPAEEIEQLAFNDAWIERASGQTALLNVSVNGKRRLTRARGDGILVSTAAGSTAYAIALGASPLPIGASMLQLVGSNIVSPARWKPVHLNQDVVVEVAAQDTWKRPCHAYVDGVDVGMVSKLTVRSSRVAGVQLAFSKSCDLQAKLYELQFPQ